MVFYRRANLACKLEGRSARDMPWRWTAITSNPYNTANIADVEPGNAVDQSVKTEQQNDIRMYVAKVYIAKSDPYLLN